MVLLTICWHFRDVAAIWHSGNRKKLVPFLSQFSHDDKEELTLIYQRSEIKEMIGNQPLRLNEDKGRFQILVDFFPGSKKPLFIHFIQRGHLVNS